MVMFFLSFVKGSKSASRYGPRGSKSARIPGHIGGRQVLSPLGQPCHHRSSLGGSLGVLLLSEPDRRYGRRFDSYAELRSLLSCSFTHCKDHFKHGYIQRHAAIFSYRNLPMHVQYCDIRRFTVLHNRHHKVSCSSCIAKPSLFR